MGAGVQKCLRVIIGNLTVKRSNNETQKQVFNSLESIYSVFSSQSKNIHVNKNQVVLLFKRNKNPTNRLACDDRSAAKELK